MCAATLRRSARPPGPDANPGDRLQFRETVALGLREDANRRQEARHELRRLLRQRARPAQLPEVPGAGAVDRALHPTRARVVRRDRQQPVAEAFAVRGQGVQRDLGRFPEVAPLVEPAIHLQRIAARPEACDLPDADRAARRHRIGEITRLDHRQQPQLLRQPAPLDCSADVIGVDPRALPDAVQPSTPGPLGELLDVVLDARVVARLPVAPALLGRERNDADGEEHGDRHERAHTGSRCCVAHPFLYMRWPLCARASARPGVCRFGTGWPARGPTTSRQRKCRPTPKCRRRADRCHSRSFGSKNTRL